MVTGMMVEVVGSALGTLSHEDMPRDPSWQALQVVLSERVTAAIVAREVGLRVKMRVWWSGSFCVVQW